VAVVLQEFCTGGILRQALQGNMFGPQLQQRWLPICSILEGIASGMDYMHAKRICHGDLNPNNVLLHVRPLPLLSRPSPLPFSACVAFLAAALLRCVRAER
jgi:serine/threonine protein kinase